MLTSARLRLIPATAAIARADLAGPLALAEALATPVHPSWPPPLFDAPAIRHALRLLVADPAATTWTYHYLVQAAPATEKPVLVGIAGYKSPPSDGAVEVGYSVVPEHQGQGLATEAVTTLVRHAFGSPEVGRVLAETLPGLAPSIAVLEKNGFRLIGEGSEPGVIRYEISRSDYEAGRTRIPVHLRQWFRLLAHQSWADHRVIAALTAASASESSVLRLYAHVLGAEAVWLARLEGAPSTTAVWPDLTLPECRNLADRLELGYRDFVWSLSPADLGRMVTYRNSAGDQYQTAVEDILLHVCLHGAYHRGQIATRLRTGGDAPATTDYIAFIRGAAAAVKPAER